MDAEAVLVATAVMALRITGVHAVVVMAIAGAIVLVVVILVVIQFAGAIVQAPAGALRHNIERL
jgi:uncharacterized membrane protein